MRLNRKSTTVTPSRHAIARALSPGWYFRAVLILSTGLLAAALSFEHSGGQTACELCAYQRIPYIVGIVLASLAILVCDPDAHPGWFGMTLANICMLGFFASAGIAGFHYLIAENWVIVSDTVRAALLNQDAWMTQTGGGGAFAICKPASRWRSASRR
jgi:disulfide bond formation protein DsbB